MPSSARYAPLPNQRVANDLADNEMEAAFDDSDNESDDGNDHDESRPLTHTRTPSQPHTQPPSPQPEVGGYDFENVEYDYPPPGSPPGPSTVALPNHWGNTNGIVPTDPISYTGPRQSWWRRTAGAILPASLSQRPTSRTFGGGIQNDGVFANVTAKPAAPQVVVDGDETYVVHEYTQKDAPPSYASAQADAVPPYWETTVHAPSASSTPGEMIIDSLQTGSLFSFLWNMLVSVSFQFVGFLLTYLLHTTHAAKLGSRAGLGITLIQYGFALRSRAADMGGIVEENPSWQWPPATPSDVPADPTPSFPGGATADLLFGGQNNNTTTQDVQAMYVLSDATTEWLSFFLMTVGWFILLTSVLGFWRVKRWERGILASNRSPDGTASNPDTSRGLLSSFEGVVGLQMFSGNGRVLFDAQRLERMEEGDAVIVEAEDGTSTPTDPTRARIVAEARANEARLMQDLRSAGLL